MPLRWCRLPTLQSSLVVWSRQRRGVLEDPQQASRCSRDRLSCSTRVVRNQIRSGIPSRNRAGEIPPPTGWNCFLYHQAPGQQLGRYLERPQLETYTGRSWPHVLPTGKFFILVLTVRDLTCIFPVRRYQRSYLLLTYPLQDHGLGLRDAAYHVWCPQHLSSHCLPLGTLGHGPLWSQTVATLRRCLYVHRTFHHCNLGRTVP